MDQLLLLLPLVLLGLLVLSGRRRQKAAAATQRDLAPGAEVITTAGLYGRVVEVQDVAVVLEVSPGVRTRWARGAIARVVDSTATTPDTVTTTGPATSGAGTTDPGAGSGSVADPALVVDPGDRSAAGPDAPGPQPGAPRR